MSTFYMILGGFIVGWNLASGRLLLILVGLIIWYVGFSKSLRPKR